MSDIAKVQVLIVEDESSIAETLLFVLEAEGYHCTWCQTGLEAKKAMAEYPPDLIVLDVGLPDQSGFDLCREIRKTNSVPILFVTARNEEIDRILGLELGGDDYVTKPFSPREIVARVKAILRRGKAVPAQPRSTKAFTVDHDRMVISFCGTALDLSRYEYRLLMVLLRRPGRVFSREELMNIAWESPEMSLERTVDTHIKTIRSKLKAVKNEKDPIVTHRGFGYSLREDL